MKKTILLFICSLFLYFNIQSQTVYVTNTGEKYHASTCRYLSKSKIAIELKDALDQNYTACKVCRPTTTVKSETKVQTKETPAPAQKTSSQCTATTKAGSRCKRVTTSSNGKCWQHGGN